MALNPDLSDQASFLQTRDPSIWGWDQRVRYVAPVRKQLFNEVIEEEEIKSKPAGIDTFLRLKPFAVGSTNQATLAILNETTVVTKPPKDSATFKNQISGRVVYQYSFSKVFGSDTPQKEIFDGCVAYQVKDFILGSNCLVFAYGTTNAGKTYTIQGNGSSPGIIPRSLDLLFKSIRGQVAGIGRYKPDKVEGIIHLDSASMLQELEYKNRVLQWNWDKPLEPIKCVSISSISSNVSGNSETDFISSTFREMQKTLSDSPVGISSESDVVYGVWVSFAEVYNESIFDLLDPILTRNRKRVPLKMAQDSEGNTYIRDLKMIHVASGDEAFHVMLYGKANLQVAATNMNSHSSRSHCIFTIRLVRYANTENPSFAIVSSFTFCDLAGAERVKKTLNAGDRLKESNNINTSLHVLGRCLATIRDNQRKNERKPVPFRDSKLTRIFQRALTGHERITMFVNANTSPILFDETVNVLKFSAIAKQIILETPIKKSKPVKKSRFSIMVSKPNNHGTILWDATHQDDSSITSVRSSSETCIQKYNAQNEELLSLVERLKEQVAEEREKNLTLERSVRLKVTETFSKIITDMEKSWKVRLRDVEERNENLSTWRIAQLENYYKEKLEGSRKRLRESEADDSVIECTSPTNQNQEKEIVGLKDEVKLLEDKCSALHQLLKEAQDVQASISAENTALKFDISIKTAELVKYQRQMVALHEEVDGGTNTLAKELQLQLGAEKKKLADEIKKNENLRELLDEAKQDFHLLTQEKDEAVNESSKLQNELLAKLDELAEVNQNLEATQLMLAQKSGALIVLEEKYDSLLKTHENCEKSMKKVSTTLKEHEEAMLAIDEIQFQLESLRVSDEGSTAKEVESKTELPTSLIARTNSVSEILAKKLLLFRNTTDDLHKLQSCLEENAKKLKSKEVEESALKHRVAELEKQLQEFKSAKSNSDKCNQASHSSQKTLQEQQNILSKLQEEKSSLETEVCGLKATLAESNRLKETETKLLQKDLKDLLKKNMSIEQQLKDAGSKLDESQRQSSLLEKELKSALQKSSSLLNTSSSSQIDQAKTLEEIKNINKNWKEELSKQMEQLRAELKDAQDKNQSLEDEIKLKESEVASIHANRNEVFQRYEDSLRKANEEVEREKRESCRLRDALYKSTPKSNENAEIRRLKEQVESLQAELGLKRSEEQASSSKKVPRSGKKVKQELVSSNDSLKENATGSLSVPVSACKQKRATTAVNVAPSSDSKVQPIKETLDIAPPQSERKPRRRNRRLFSKNQTLSFDSDEVEPIEVECMQTTTPNSYFKRSLRSRKV